MVVGPVARGRYGCLRAGISSFRGPPSRRDPDGRAGWRFWSLSSGHRGNSGESRARALAMAAALAGLGILLSAVQWIPSKELLDRSPRAGGLSWGDLTYASWSPELLPTMVVREAYGTRARDTDWTDGFYPYHEMNTYLGLIAIVLAVVGAAGKPAHDRWVTFWVLLVGLSLVLMLGKFTFLFDFAHKIPILGSSREPVRFHLWAALGVAALAATGVERLVRSPGVSLRPGLDRGRIALPSLHSDLARSLLAGVARTGPMDAAEQRPTILAGCGHELLIATIRTVVLCATAWFVARKATRDARRPAPRAGGLLSCRS